MSSKIDFSVANSLLMTSFRNKQVANVKIDFSVAALHRKDRAIIWLGGGGHRAQSARCPPPHTPQMKPCLFDRREKSIPICHHTLRPLFPGLGARNDKALASLLGWLKVGAKRPLSTTPSEVLSLSFRTANWQ